MADYLNIAGRVRTTASDGVAMEAQEVKDLNLNKSQQEINSDVQTELGDRYTKEETYSKEQLDDLITTPDVNHVSVVATNATTAVTDVLPVTGEANTIYRVGNWDGTQYDTTMYALFAWNGSAYVCLAVRSFVGEVYDISVNHPDGQGNPTPYADLTAALGTDGANIPADIRRGGMSIKFIQGTVQSSDNNYVQFRYMSSDASTVATFTNVANWQGVDDEPTVGSHNLVESGGVSAVVDGKTVSIEPVANGVLYCVLNYNSSTQEVVVQPTANSNDFIRFYPVEQGKTYRISIATTRSGRAWGWCDNYLSAKPDSDTNIGGKISTDAPGSGVELVKEITNTEGFPYIVLAFKVGTDANCAQIVDSNVVLYSSVQRKTDVEKQTARNNIGAASETGLNDVTEEVRGLVGYLVGYEKYDVYEANSYYKTTTFSHYFKGGRKVKLTNLEDSGFTSHAIAIYYDREAAGTRLYNNMSLSDFPFEFTLPFDCQAILVADGGTGSSVHQKWKLEYQNDVIGSMPKLMDDVNSQINGANNKIYPLYTGKKHIDTNLSVGDTISFSESPYRSVAKFDVSGLTGKIRLEKVLGAGNNKDVAICDSSDKILALLSNTLSTEAEQVIIFDLEDYPTAKYIYADGAGTIVNAAVGYNFEDGIKNSLYSQDLLPKKGALLLHFDGPINPDDPRIPIIREYGFKVSWCVAASTFSNTGSYSGDWTSDTIRDLYWQLIEEGHDIGIYNSNIYNTVAEWDTWLDKVVTNLAQKGIFNVSAIHCGLKVVNTALVESAKKHGIHILRGGGNASDGDNYPYTDDNILVPVKASQSTLYVLKSGVIDNGVHNIARNALNMAMQQNKVYSLFAHGIGTGGTNISESSFRSMMDIIADMVTDGLTLLNWREFYRMMNPIDGSSNDYLRLLKMAKETT